jgi:beta-glucosidase/6-phospho-beta-glucosidase/beta-galactosidase
MPLTIYTVKEACKELADRNWEITDKGLRKAMDRGELLYKKIGKTYVITEDDLKDYIQRGRPRRGPKPK